MAFRALFSSPARRGLVKPPDKTQSKCIVRWVNSVLAPRKLEVRDIAEDFRDGVNLCNLLELVSGKDLPKYKPRAIIHAQKQDNCDIAFKFMTSNGLKLDFSADVIVKGDLTNTAELLLKIFLHFQLVKAVAADPQAEPASAVTKLWAIRNVTAWVNRKLPSPVKDLTAFGNGSQNLCALVDALAPEARINKASTLDGLKAALDYAESKMGVVALLDAEDFMTEQEEFTFCMYTSQFMSYRSDPANGIDAEEAKRKADEEEAKKLAEIKKPPPPSPKSPKPSKWTRVKDAEGKAYYWNEETDETSWDMPAGFVDPDAPPPRPSSPPPPSSSSSSGDLEAATLAATNARAEADSAKARVESERKRADEMSALAKTALDKQINVVWTKVMSDNGTPYFWNERTNQTTWDRPPEYEEVPTEDELKRLNEDASSANTLLANVIADAEAAEARAVAAENALAALKAGGAEQKVGGSSESLAQKRAAVDAAKDRVNAATQAEKDALEAEAKAKADLVAAETAMHKAELDRTTADASQWTEVPADDGKCYYWNESNDETTWDKPANFFSEAEKKVRAEQEANAKSEYRSKADAVPLAEAAVAAAVAATKEAVSALATAEAQYDEESRNGSSSNGISAPPAAPSSGSSSGGVAAARDRVEKATSAVMATSDVETETRNKFRGAQTLLEKVMQDRAAAASSKWTEVPADDGKCYYWNESNDETTWDKPSGFFTEAEKVKLASEEETARANVTTARADYEKATADANAAVAELDAADSALKVAEADALRQGDLPPPPRPADSPLPPPPRPSEPAAETKAPHIDPQEDKELAEAEAAVDAAKIALANAKEAATVAEASASRSESEAADSTCTWTKVPADDGKFYFWNESNDETTWDAPQAYVEFEERKKRAAEAKAFAKEALEKAAAAQEAFEKAEAAFKSLRADKEERAKAGATSPTTASLEAFFTKPAAPPAKKSPWTAVKDAEGKTYYWNEETNATSWDKPADFDEPKPAEVDLLSGDKPAPTEEQKLLDMFSGTKPSSDPFAGLDNFLSKPGVEELATALATAEADKAKKAKDVEDAVAATTSAVSDVKTIESIKEDKEREAETLSAEADNARKTFEKQPWAAVKAANGEYYYWNQSTDETAWDKPAGFVDEASIAKLTDRATTAKAEAAIASDELVSARKKVEEAEAKQAVAEQDHREAVTKEEQARARLESVKSGSPAPPKELSKLEQMHDRASKDERYAKLLERAKSPWTSVKAENGQVYYWNEKTDQTSWDKPPEWVDVADESEVAKVITELKEAEEEDKLNKEKQAREESERAEKEKEAQREREAKEAEEKAAKEKELSAGADEIKENAEKAFRAAVDACKWTAVKAENGQVYYWNKDTDETAWDKPASFIDADDPAAKEPFIKAEEEAYAKRKEAAEQEKKEAEEKAAKEKELSAGADEIKENAEKAFRAAVDACKWTAVKAENGQVYYWNKDTDETAWDKPAAFVDAEDPAAKEPFIKAEEEAYAKRKEAAEREEKEKADALKAEEEKAKAPPPKSKWTAVSDGNGKFYYWNESTDQTTWDKPQELAEQEEREEKEKQQKEQKEREEREKEEKEKEFKEKEDAARVKASKWTEVKDSEGKSYYWNQETDQTSWDKPAVMIELEELEKARKQREDEAALAFLNSATPAKTEILDSDSEAAILLKLEERAKGRSMGRRNTGLMLMGLEARKAEDKIRRGSLPEDPGLNPDLAVDFDNVAVAPVLTYAGSGVRYELQISCTGLVKFKWLAAICPLVGVFGRGSSDQPWQLLSRTEWIQSSVSPVFRVPVTVHEYSGHPFQQLCFKVYCVDDATVDENDVMGWAETTMQAVYEAARYRDTLSLTLQTVPGRSQDTSTARISISCRSTDVRSVANSAGAAEIRHQAMLRSGEKEKRQTVLKGLQAPSGQPPSAEAVARAKADRSDDLDMGGDAKDEKTEDPNVNTRVRLEGYYLPSYTNSSYKLKLKVSCSRLIKMDWLSLSDPIVALFSQERDSLLNQTEWQLNEHDPVFKNPLALPIYDDDDSLNNLRLRVYDVDDEVVKVDDMMGYVDVSLNELQASCFTNTPVEFAIKHSNRRRQKRLDKKSSTVTIQATYVP